ncbi:MAG: S8 family serine peptidase, partial [Cyclobacteriaceae bacterium]|nr:S8 family serine peptidase [Cyclobacteriaceae bacterium]
MQPRKVRGGLGCVVLFSASNSARQNQGDIGQIGFPSNVNIPGVITVGASERNDLQSDYSPTSNLGSVNNQVIDIVAPSHRAYPPTAYPAGVVGGIVGETFEAWSIDIPANAGYNPWPQFTAGTTASVNPPAIGEQLPNAGVNFQSYTGRFGGTSHSCPVVAGVAALMLSANPNLTQQQIFDLITGNADRVGGYVYTNGRSNELGFGRVNACRAV